MLETHGFCVVTMLAIWSTQDCRFFRDWMGVAPTCTEIRKMIIQQNQAIPSSVIWYSYLTYVDIGLELEEGEG